MQFDQPYSNLTADTSRSGHDGFLYASFGGGSATILGNGQKKDVCREDLRRYRPRRPLFDPGGQSVRERQRQTRFTLTDSVTWLQLPEAHRRRLWAGDVVDNKSEDRPHPSSAAITAGAFAEAPLLQDGPCPVRAESSRRQKIRPLARDSRSRRLRLSRFGDPGPRQPVRLWRLRREDLVDLDRANDARPPCGTVATTSIPSSFRARTTRRALRPRLPRRQRIHRLVSRSPGDGLPVKLARRAASKRPARRSPPQAPPLRGLPLSGAAARRARWMRPAGERQISLATDGDFDLPVGTVLVKEFKVGGKRIRPSLFVRHPTRAGPATPTRWDDARRPTPRSSSTAKRKDVPGTPAARFQRWTYRAARSA